MAKGGKPAIRRSQADRRAETRALLIAAAVELLQTIGYSQLTTARTAKHAGVTTGALHYHFATKNDLIFGVLDDATTRAFSRLEGMESLPASGTPSVRSMVQHLWLVYGDPAYWAVWEIVIGTRSDPELAPRIMAHRNNTVRTIVRPWLQLSIGAHADEADIIKLFNVTMSLVRGFSLERNFSRSDDYFDDGLNLLAEFVEQKYRDIVAAAELQTSPAPAQPKQ